ncbi:MAG: right-handed parallel beta-helix repeat-containing protein [Alistipes sp.]|nr:right-handed parallel beta-helix repeat-containing protein [Alistipes sp.]
MKKQSILFFALLAAVSCQKENTQDIAPVFDSNVELRASFDEQSSRIATEDGLTFSLEEGKEQIGVYIQNDGMNALENVLYTAGTADEQGWISFTTQMPVQVQSTSKFFAYAPYSATTVDVSGSTEGGATDGGAIEPAAAGSGWNGKRAINLPDLQEQPAAGVKTDIAKYYSVVAAPATPVARDVLDSYSVNLQFSGVFALVRFGLNNFTEGEIKVSKIVFSAENAALTGYFSVDLTHENPKLSNTEYAPEAVAGKTFDKVTVTLAEPATIAAQEMAEVYAVVNACAVTAPKLTVYATDAEGKDIVFEKTLSDKTFSRQQRTAIGVKLENPVAADYAQEVIDALKNGGTVKIEKDVDLSSKGAFEIAAGTTVEFIVNEGLTVTANYGQIINNGTMTISGNGLMNISESDTAPADYSAVITNHGTMTVDGINIISPSPKRSIGILNDGGDITINDCHIESGYFALECKNGGQAEINGGTFISTSNNSTKDENGKVMCGYCVRVYGAGSEMVVNNATVIGVQGGLASTYGANLIVKDGMFSTYYIDDKFINFYALYVAQDATATVEGGKFYSEGSRAAVMIGNEDVPGGNYGITYLKGGFYEDMGHSDLTKQTIRAAQGYLWQELVEPLVITNEINGKTNTYYYQIVEGEDLGYKEVDGGYEIYSAKGLQWLAEQVNGGDNFKGKTITLTADIDLENAEWTPIGSKANPFAGKFDGGNRTISNLNVNNPEEAFKGLFGRLVDPGTISNVNIDNATVKGLSQVGAIVGSAYTGSVSNCHVSGDIAIEGNYQVGGIAGNGYATISDCSVIGNAGSYVKGTYKENNLEGDAVGGIIGYACEEHTENDVISGCSATIDVSGTRKVGGIAGQCGHTANLGSCTFSGNVATNADETYIAGNAGKIMVGGLVGELTSDGGTQALCALYIRNCTVAEGSTVTGVDAKTTGAILGGSRTAGYTLTEENNTTTGVTVIPGGGNGTIAEGIELTPDGTYNIVSAAGVKSLAELVNAGDNFEGKTIVLTADANLGGEEWTPIGIGTREGSTYTGNAFKGTFDGNGKTISGLKISERSNSAGLIGVLDGGTVKNVTLNVDIDVAATRNESAAGCVGLLTNNGLVENVTVNGSVKSEKAAAGIVSRVLKSGTVRNCHNHATISGTSYNIGGIVGAAYYDNEGMTIEGCTNDGAVSGTLAVGGIAGLSAAEVKNCSNSATVTGNGTSVGGVIGEQQNAGSITGCTNTGNVKNNTEAYGNGGIVGWIRYSGGTTNYPHMNIITVSGCENRGSVSGGNDAGGIVGTVYNHGVVDNNRNYAPTLSAKTFVAGVVGNVQFDTTADGITDEQHVYVTNNYSETTLDNMTGGLKAKFVYINNSDKTTDSGNTPDDGVQVSTAEEAIAAIQGGGKVTVAGAIDKIDFTTLNPTAPVELVLNAKVGEIVLGSSASNPAQTTITVAKDVDYPTFSVAKEKDIQNLTIIGDPTSSKACTSGINALNQGITTVKNVTIKGVRFQGKGVHFGFTANPQTTQSIVVEECEGIDMVEPLFYTSNNEYVNTHVGDITIRNNKATFSASAANTVNALYICVTTTGTVLIENNTFINPPKHGIMASSNACENFIVRGNTFTNPVEDGVKIDYPINNVVIENNTITPTEYGIRIARFKSDYNPTVTISGNNIDMSNTKDAKFNGISIAPNEANGQAKLVIKENVKVAGNVTEWFSINSALVLNEGSDVATPFNN